MRAFASKEWGEGLLAGLYREAIPLGRRPVVKGDQQMKRLYGPDMTTAEKKLQSRLTQAAAHHMGIREGKQQIFTYPQLLRRLQRAAETINSELGTTPEQSDPLCRVIAKVAWHGRGHATRKI